MNKKIGKTIKTISEGIVLAKIDISAIIELVEEGVLETRNGTLYRKSTPLITCKYLLGDGWCDFGPKDGCMHTTNDQKCGLRIQS